MKYVALVLQTSTASTDIFHVTGESFTLAVTMTKVVSMNDIAPTSLVFQLSTIFQQSAVYILPQRAKLSLFKAPPAANATHW